MPGLIFGFLQAELPFELGPPDGRFPLREEPDGEIAGIVVLSTLRATHSAPRGSRMGRSRRDAVQSPEPATVPLTRATVIDVQRLAEGSDAEDWLRGLDAEREQLRAFATLNRILTSHRIAAANPYVHEIHPSQAIALRVGFGAGEQVADGRWLRARELAPAAVGPQPAGRRRRAAQAAHRESRLADLLGARARPLLCEELVLRARLDLDQGRPALAALCLEQAYTAGVPELRVGAGTEMRRRVEELQTLAEGVSRLAAAAVTAAAGGPADPARSLSEAQAEELANALGRLEAALRARALLGA